MRRFWVRLAAFARQSQLLLLALGLYAVGLAFGWVGVHFSLDDPVFYPHSIGGVALFILVGATLVGLGMPRQIIAWLGGGAFGFDGGVALALAAQGIGCLGNFVFARLLGRRWVQKRMGPRVAAFERFLVAHPFSTILMLRLMPKGSNLLVSLLAGLSGIDPLRFLAASLIGFVPQTVVFALVGSGIRVGSGLRELLAVALFAASGLLGGWLVRHYCRNTGASFWSTFTLILGS